MNTYYVDNKPVKTNLLINYSKLRNLVDYSPYCNAQTFDKLVKLIVNLLNADNSFIEIETGELLLTPVSEFLSDDYNFEIWDDDDLDWFVFCVAQEMKIV